MTTAKFKTSLTLICAFALTVLPCAFGEHHTGKHSADAMFKSMDSDGDGRASRAEHAASALKTFTDVDTNRDGQVTLAEMKADKAKMNAAMPVKADKPMKDGMSAEEMIKMCDANGDGQVSTAEHTAHADAMFTKMDTDGDGFLSSSECSAGHDRMMSDKKSTN